MSKYLGLSILLTGAIDIEYTPFAISAPKNIRLNEYINSITYMLKKYKKAFRHLQNSVTIFCF